MGESEARCRYAIKRLYMFLDEQLEDADCAEMTRHVEQCLRCGGLVAFERELRAVVRQKCAEQHVPDGLEERLRAELRKLVESPS